MDGLVAWGTGFGMGFVISVLGAGGSIFIVPVLILGFATPVAIATGTSLAVVFAAALVGAFGHARAGHVRGRVVVLFGGASAVGAVLGAQLHALVPEQVNGRLFALALIAATIAMVRDRSSRGESTGRVAAGRLVPIGLAVGVVTGLLGVGGGFFIVPALLWGAGLGVRDAIGTSLAVIAASGASGAVSHAFHGGVDFALIASVGGGAVLGALVGAPVCAKIPERPLRLVFASAAGLLALYLLARGWSSA